ETTSTELRSFIAGGLAGVIAKSMLSPVDRIKLLFQVSDHLRFSLRNALHMGVDIAKRDGVQALFRGNTINLVKVFMSAGIQHSSFDYIRRRFHDANSSNHHGNTPYVKKLSNAQLIASGSLAGTYAFLFHVGGLRSFSRGLFVNLVGIVPYTGIGFSLNERFKQSMLEFQHEFFAPANPDSYQLSPFSKFMCSYLAGSIAQTGNLLYSTYIEVWCILFSCQFGLVTYPLDTVRRRIQTDGYVTGATDARKYINMRTTCKIILDQEGLRGFYKGATVTWMRVRAHLSKFTSLT
ncbi:hypothetical protein AaE_006301, partial [Aphanomyces astaci]